MANDIPKTVSKVHLIAVCGTGMGALACMLKDLGFSVTGSDNNVYPPMSSFLEARGIEIQKGFDGEHLAYSPDLVVVGNAVRKDNPEAVRMLEMGLNYCSMPQALNRFVVAGKKSLLVAGTHGKTTTASILAWILMVAGLDPSFMIGGIVKNFNGNYRLGKGDVVVLEGDEYDTAFFDKRSKFLHYDPHIAILTSVEFDHADIFLNMAQVKTAFDRFIATIRPENTLIAYDGDACIDALVAGRNMRLERYGRQAASDWRIGKSSVDPPWNRFEVVFGEKSCGMFKTRMVGEHNRLNALSAIAAARQLGIDDDAIAKALETYDGVKRRQEVRGVAKGVTVIDDFAHHPTAVCETIRAVRPFYSGGRLIAVFEPRTNTSMRSIFQRQYASAFDLADLICVREPPLLSKIPEGVRFSSGQLVADLKSRGKDAHYFPDTESIIEFMFNATRPKDVVLIMSNGGFDNIHERLLSGLSE
jgi:UDP-N-acetylmuramate: L-alanyl-gamma-D-glutamyl-meso-diaminopimelate ligase